MKCQEVYHLMQAYLDVAVTPEQERQVEAHIRACPKCRRRLVQLAQAANRLEDDKKASLGNDFAARLIARLGAGQLGDASDDESKSATDNPDKRLR